ncbi:hypothetical protein OCU04_005231 [Sclerotinia nivalis]|uniref:Uncharacterized protein n=1 Tax=Sclerotinia nivalis TaxID=352851 RepID=A0A9X0ANP2_9HELO|nr:hypothetical protein OCU04_005231 [Sclerotinia nivalis]
MSWIKYGWMGCVGLGYSITGLDGAFMGCGTHTYIYVEVKVYISDCASNGNSDGTKRDLHTLASTPLWIRKNELYHISVWTPNTKGCVIQNLDEEGEEQKIGRKC